VWTTNTKSIGGCKYYVNFIDDHIKKVWVYFMKHKGEMFQHFLSFKVMSKNVVFDEMVNWYSPMKIKKYRKAKNGDVS
jgi:hypothetical protein